MKARGLVYLIGVLLLVSCSKSSDPKQDPDLSEGLIAFYPFDGNANDESGNSNHGVLMGQASVDNSLVIGDNENDYLLIPHTLMDNLTDFSCAAMLRINTLHTTGRLPGNNWIGGAAASNANVFGVFYDPVEKAWEFSFFLAPGGRGVFFYDDAIEDGAWHHIVATRTGSIARLFIDGVEIGGGISVSDLTLVIEQGGLIVGQEQDELGGSFEPDQSWAGEIDNLSIYNRALDEDQVQALFEHDGAIE